MHATGQDFVFVSQLVPIILTHDVEVLKMMFVAYTVVVVCRKLVGELKDCCSNNGGLEKKKKKLFSNTDGLAAAC